MKAYSYFFIFSWWAFSSYASNCGYIPNSSRDPNLKTVFKACVLKNPDYFPTEQEIVRCSGIDFDEGSATVLLGEDILVTALHLFIGRDEMKASFNIGDFLENANDQYRVYIMDSNAVPVIAEASIVHAFKIDEIYDGIVALKLPENSGLKPDTFHTWKDTSTVVNSPSVVWKGFHIDKSEFGNISGKDVFDINDVRGLFTAQFNRFQGYSGGAIIDKDNYGIILGIGLGGLDKETLEANTYFKSDLLIAGYSSKLINIPYILDRFSKNVGSKISQPIDKLIKDIKENNVRVLSRLVEDYDHATAYMTLMRCEEYSNISNKYTLIDATFELQSHTCSSGPSHKCLSAANVNNIEQQDHLVSYVNRQRGAASQVINDPSASNSSVSVRQSTQS